MLVFTCVTTWKTVRFDWSIWNRRKRSKNEISQLNHTIASDTRKVERIQERALRIVYNSHSETYTNLSDRAKLPSLLNRPFQDIVILMYKAKYGLVPDFICDNFSIKSCRYNFRNQNFDFQSRFNSVLYGKHSLRYFGPFLWNKLDKNITETSSLSRFKLHIRCKDLTELINGNNFSACVICTS